jgi:hypothetical protein
MDDFAQSGFNEEPIVRDRSEAAMLLAEKPKGRGLGPLGCLRCRAEALRWGT